VVCTTATNGSLPDFFGPFGVFSSHRECAGPIARYVHFSTGRRLQVSTYLVIGHESLGEAVKGLKPGDLVVSMVRRPCVHERHRP
jgi:hypothetical protein